MSAVAQTGSLTIAITDGPVDTANIVNVRFDAVLVKPVDEAALEFTVDDGDGYRDIDLLTLTGNVSENLLEDVEVPAGNYEWIRLSVLAEHDEVLDSFIELSDGNQLELWVPSGSKNGLRINHSFSVAAGESVDLTIDFDLRKSVTNPPGLDGAILKPTLRVVGTLESGSLEGIIAPEVVSEACENSGENDGAVYVFNGPGATPVDIQEDSAANPVTTASVELDDGQYSYEAGFLEPGTYTVAYTCDNEVDDPEEVDEEVSFIGTEDVEVEAGETSTHNFE